MQSAGQSGRRQYRNVTTHRGEGEEGVEETKHELTIRTIEPYLDMVKKNTQFFSTIEPNFLLGELQAYFKENGHEVTVDPKRYKLKVTIKSSQEAEDENEEMEDGEEEEKAKEDEVKEVPVEMTINILQVGDNQQYCVEFNRKNGDQLHFFQEFQGIRDELAELQVTAAAQ